MTVKRVAALLLSLLLLLGALPSALADSPHTHSWKEKSRVEPTCTKDGYAVYVCSCGARKTEPLPALGHKFSKKVYVSYADCEHYGVFYWICERCGAHSENGNDKPLGHDWDGGVITKQPTETDEGEIVYTCRRDPSHTKTEALPIKGGGSGKTYSTARIIWDDDDDKAGLRPAEVQVDFKASHGDPETTTVTLSGGNGWEYTMTDLPLKNEKGKGIYYYWSNSVSGLPESYKLVNVDVDKETVYSIGYYPVPDDPHPALTLSATEDKITESKSEADNYGGASYDIYLDTLETVTNTGNIPLQLCRLVWLNSDVSGEGDRNIYVGGLEPEGTRSEKHLTSLYYYYEELDSPESHVTDHIIATPDDPQFRGYCDVSICYYGYDIDDTDREGEILCKSNVVTLRAYVPKVFEPEEEEEPELPERSRDYCALTLESLSGNEAKYTLHTCSEHIETAEAAEKLSLAGDWAGAAELWKGEIEELYAEMAEKAGEAAAEALSEDKEAFFEYADAVQALFGDEEAAELMRLRCAEMCCVKSTAPIRLPSSLMGGHETLDASESFEVSGRKVGALNGCNSEVVEHYAGPAAEAMAKTRALLDTDANGAFAQAAEYWKTAVDDTVSAVYRTAGREIRTLIAAWSMSLNYLCESDIKLYSLIYPADPDAAQEHMMDLYRNAALLIGGMG
ncbi:MAG: Cna B-type domain-containing protein [Clostridia bacterium]|nr:Cna B-type domain-containing protein [Clostridia bacterium]